MKKRILIIHGWGEDSNKRLFLKKKEGLEKLGYGVVIPNMPNPFFPKQKEWVDVVKKLCPDEGSILVGHSLGGTTILRYLEVAHQKVGKIILFATPIKKLGLASKVIDNFLEKEFNWPAIKNNADKITALNQDRDPIIPLSHGKEIEKKLGAQLIVVKGSDHFYKISPKLLGDCISH